MKTFTKIALTSTFALSLLVTTVFADTASTTRAAALAQKQSEAISKMIAASDKEIGARITSLNSLVSKVQDMKKVSTTTKDTIASTTASEIANLTALKAKIDADTDATTLKADLKSITASYRIYALVQPQIEILAASDRIGTLADLVTIVSNKIQTLLTTLSAAGKDTSALETTLTNANAKVADAQTQAQAAISRTSGLIPDNGDATVAASNRSALMQSRADLRVGILDLHTAKTDLDSLVKAIRQMQPRKMATSTAATSTVTQ